MLKNKKILLALLVPILLFGGYTMTKAKPVAKEKIKGTIYVMPQSFLLNLSDGRYAKLDVALQLAPGQSDGAAPTPAPPVPKVGPVRCPRKRSCAKSSQTRLRARAGKR